ncbi:MAG TPA: hypothetical protein VKB80_28770 [Kofleriaceae bacterium]|nr:hypothetical protein [Kofleriaceae bacterium]
MAHHRWSSRSLVALGVAAFTSQLGLRSAAADQSLQAITSITTGYTDNVEFVPVNGDPNLTPAVTSDAFANIAPGAVFAYEGPRVLQVLRYVLDIRLYAEQSSADSFSNNLQYGAVIPLTPRAGLTLDLSASHGRLNAFDLGPQNAMVGGAGQGDQSFATGGAGMTYSYQLTPSWQYSQGLSGSIYEPLDDSVQVGRRTTAETALSLAKTLNFNAFTFTGRARYTAIAAGDDPNGFAQPENDTILVGPELRWVHDLSLDFSTDAMVGATASFAPGEFQDRSVYPVGDAYLRYTHERYAAQIGYRRNVVTNLQLGQTEITHVGEARGVIPLPFGDRWSLAGSFAYANGESVGQVDMANNDVTLKTIQWVADGALSWQITDGIGASARYQYTRQNRDSLRMVDIVEERTRRQQITISLEGTYPTRQAAELPKDSSTRVDGGLESMSKREETLVR